jgi:hypothetical protein
LEDFLALDFLVEEVLLEAAAARLVVFLAAVFLAPAFAPPRAVERAAVFFAAGLLAAVFFAAGLLAAVFFAAVFFAAVFFAAGFLADFFAAPFDEDFAAVFLVAFFAPLRAEEVEPEPPALEPIEFDLSSDIISASFKSLRATTVTLDQGNVVISSEFRLTDSVESSARIFSVDTFNTRRALACAMSASSGLQETRLARARWSSNKSFADAFTVTRC